MAQKRTVSKTWCFISAALLFIVLCAALCLEYRLPFSSVEDTVVEGNLIYGINSNGVDTEIFRVSVEDGTGKFLRVPLSSKKAVITLYNPQYYDGCVHFDEALYAQDGSVSERRVFWDEKRNRLVVEHGKGSEFFSMATDDQDWVVSAAELPSAAILEKDGREMLYLWKNGRSHLIDSVRMPFKIVAGRLILALIVSVLLYLGLRLAGNLLSYYHLDPGLRVYLCFLTLIIFLLMMPVVSEYTRHYLYAFASRHALYHVSETASLYAASINDEQLERFLELEEDFQPQRMDEVWKYKHNYAFEAPGDIQDGKEDMIPADMEAWGIYEIASGEDICVISRTGGKLRILCDDRDRIDPWLQNKSPVQRSYMVRAFEAGRVQSFVATAGKQRYATVYLPKRLSSGRRIVIGTRIPLSNVLMYFFMMRTNAVRACVLLGVLMLLIMIAAISRAFKPLDSLKKAVRGITAGDLTARASTKGFNEISHTAVEFNAMADQLERQSEGTDSYRHFYDAFASVSLLRRLSGRSLSGALRPGTSYRGKACILSVDLRGSCPDEAAKERVHAATLHSACSYGGHSGSFDEGCLRYVYTEDSESSLRSAVDFQQKLLNEGLPAVPAGITCGFVRLLVSGTDSRMSLNGPDSREAEALAAIAAALKIPVIISESLFLDVKRSYSKVHFRCLGRIGLGDYVPDAPLYELLDADPAAVKKARGYSLTIFENGVRAYARGDYFTARNEMIHVLDLEPEDLAARCYVMNCDRKEPPVVCQAKA